MTAVLVETDIERSIAMFAEALSHPRTPKSRRVLLDALDAASSILAEERMRHLIATMAGTPCGCTRKRRRR